MTLAVRSAAAERMDTECADFADYRRCLRDLSPGEHRHAHAPADPGLAAPGNPMALDSFSRAGRGLRPRRHAAPHPPLGPRPRHRRPAGGAGPQPLEYPRGRRGDSRRRGHNLPHRGRLHFRGRPGIRFHHQLAVHPPPDDDAIVTFIRWMEAHARRGWFVSDLHRHWFAYHGFGLLALAAGWHRFVRYDGRVSIARSFVPDEWRGLLASAGLAPEAADLRWHVPFRLLRRAPMRVPLIIGGGPAGAAAACLLARAGQPVTLLERHAGPVDKVCGDFLSAEAIDMLDRLGIDLPALRPAPITTVRLIHRRPDRAGLAAVRGAGRVAARAGRGCAATCRRSWVPRLLRGHAVRSASPAGLEVVGAAPPAEFASDAMFLATGKHDLRGAAPPAGRATETGRPEDVLDPPPGPAGRAGGPCRSLSFRGGYAG